MSKSFIVNQPLPPWHSDMQKALQLNSSNPESRYLQFATVSSHGLPNVRTVVFRGIQQQTGKLIFHTDRRSEKIRDIEHSPSAQLCWYLAQTREQFRISGCIEVIEHNDDYQHDLRFQQWQNLSDSAKLSYFGDNPGALLGLDDQYQAQSEAEVDLMPLNPNFTLLLLTPILVEHLQLTPTPHIRKLFRFQHETWSESRLNP